MAYFLGHPIIVVCHTHAFLFGN